jgi:hypothetical protein
MRIACASRVFHHQEEEMRLVKVPTSDVRDSGKVRIGGGGIKLKKPAPKKDAEVADSGKVRVGGGAIKLRKPTPKQEEKNN